VERVLENGEVVSRHYIERLRDNLKMIGDTRLDRALAECDTIRFALAWMTCLAATVLLSFFLESVFLGDGLDGSLMVLAAVILAIMNRAVDRRIVRHYNKRFFEAIPENLRWCFRRKP
jgi:hypothetical protein